MIEPLIDVCSTFQIEAGLVQVKLDYGYLRAFEQIQDDTVLRSSLRRNSSDWVRSRLLSWRESFHAHGASPPDIGLIKIKRAASPGFLEMVRSELRRQRELMATRLPLCAGQHRCLPPGIEQSWLAWGTSDFVTLNQTPWAAMFSSVVREVPAAAPPAAL